MIATRRTALICVGVSTLLLVIVAIRNGDIYPGMYLDCYVGGSSLVRCVCQFTLGMFAYRIGGDRWGSFVKSRAWVLYLTLLILLISLCFRGADFLVIALFPVLLIGLSGERNPVANVLASWPVKRLGLYSYSLYLLHMTFLFHVNPHLESWLARSAGSYTQVVSAPLLILILLLCSAFTYHAIEKPGRKILRHLL